MNCSSQIRTDTPAMLGQVSRESVQEVCPFKHQCKDLQVEMCIGKRPGIWILMGHLDDNT